MAQAQFQKRSVLFITHAFGFPALGGNELRILNLTRWFSKQGYRVHVAWKADPRWVSRAQSRMPDIQLHSLWQNTDRLWARPEEKGLDRYEKALCPDWLVDQVETLEALLQPDIMIAEYIFMSRCLSGSKASLKLIDTHDVFSRRKKMVERYGIKQSYYVTPSAEARMLSRADALLAIQETEAQYLRKLRPDVPVITCGVDFDEALARRKKSKRSYAAVIVASDNPANRLGIDSFLRDCWPKIRRRAPRARLALVGAAKCSLRCLPPGVEKIGLVANVSSYYEKSGVALNPIAAGTGLKIKSVEALAHGLPLVSLPNGLEGICSDGNGKAFFEAQDWNSFAENVLELLNRPAVLRQAQLAARKFARREFHSKGVYKSLETFLREREALIFEASAAESTARPARPTAP